MAKKQIKKTDVTGDGNKMKNQTETESIFSPKVESVFKLILKVMSWVVGLAFVLVIILPEFNSPSLDGITQILFYIGIINLLVFIVIEFVKDSVKQVLSRIIHE